MTKEQKTLSIEYASSLSDDDLRFLSIRLIERLSGDLPEALQFISQNPKMDEFLGSSENANAVYNNCDQIRDVLQKELKKRNMSLRFFSAAA